MRIIASISLALLLLAGCASTIQPYSGNLIVEVTVKEYETQNSWQITDPYQLSIVQAIFSEITPVSYCPIHSSVTFVPLDYHLNVRFLKGQQHWYELSKDCLRNQDATWPITSEQYQSLETALNLK